MESNKFPETFKVIRVSTIFFFSNIENIARILKFKSNLIKCLLATKHNYFPDF